MSRRRSYCVQELALMAGVSVRALHHYDEVGLLVPKERTSAGYRLYHDDDLLRLQQILIGRELGLALEEIRRSLDDPQFDRKQALLVARMQDPQTKLLNIARSSHADQSAEASATRPASAA
jgi:MerR family transcriptional regulator, thiopeptide resistance regulator